jgi:nucleotide-binding universal stress UspA family protein
MSDNTPQRVITVPMDFTSRAMNALDHAIIMARATNSSIVLIHVINRETRNKLKKENKTEEDIKKQLQKICDDLLANHKLSSFYETPEGSIFSDLGEVTEKKHARFMMMGTHGVVGLEQKLLGAWALKVVTSSPVPTIVVQDRQPNPEGYKKIVVPIDFNRESKQMVYHVCSIAKYFNSEVHILIDDQKDEFLHNSIQLNKSFTERIFKGNNIRYEIEQSKSHADFKHSLVDYSERIGADLITIMSRNDADIAAVILGDDEQKLINNHPQIPVMCINPLHVAYDTNFVLNP